MSTLADNAINYLDAGLCVLPADRTVKYPCINSWKQYQKRLPTSMELTAWFSNPQNGLCVITGAVSGHLEMIDFDLEGERFDAWCEKIKAQEPQLLDRLVVETSQSGGWHVLYRCQSQVSGSMKLAQRRIQVEAKDIYLKKNRPFTCIQGKEYAVRQDAQGKHVIVTLIETRGEGGLFLCAPTDGYELVQGSFEQLPTMTERQRDMLLMAAWELNEYLPDVPAVKDAPLPSDRTTGLRPGDDFNQRGDVRELLRAHGWQRVRADNINELWRRPGKTNCWSASLRIEDQRFYVFSSNAYPFEPNQDYRPFAVYTMLEHNGDFSKAALMLSKQGYGEKTQQTPAQNTDVDLSGMRSNEDEEDEWDDGAISLTELIANFQGLNKPLIHGLLREGETMNIIASPKIGKSWLVNSLTISIASGMDWLGFKVEPGRVLLIDNELHRNTTTYRYIEVTKALGLASHLYSDNLKVRSLRGELKDLNQLSEMFKKIKPGRYDVIVIDAFYRTLPSGTDENDNGAIAGLYNQLDVHANQLKCAFILIHHTSKGNQANKSVTDVGAGAGSQSRAADTHVILRGHEEDDKVVMDAATRSWPPLKTLVLAKQHPLFVIDDDADPTALAGSLKTSSSKKQLTLEEFVNTCVATQDPCSQRAVIYEGSQRHDLSERRAKEMLLLAEDRGLVTKITTGSTEKFVTVRPGISGEKGYWAAAILIHDPEQNVAEIARKTGASERHIRRIKTLLEADMNPDITRTSVGTMSAPCPP